MRGRATARPARAVLVLATLSAVLLLTPAAAPAQQADPELGAIAAMIEAGRLEPAEARLRELLERRESPLARDLLGVVLGRLERPAEAEAELLRAVELAPELAPARRHLARLYLRQERQPEAAEQLRAAARLEPLGRELGLRLAALEQAAGDRAAAEEQLRAVAERYGSVTALLELARLATVDGEHAAALTTLRRALALAPNSEAVLRAHAEVSLAAGAPIAAAWTLEPLARMHPGVVDYPYLLGVARLRVGDAAGAAEALRTALELDPDRALTLVALGLAYNNQQLFDEAEEVLARSLRLEPGDPEALAALAQAEEGLGKLEEAERHARRALQRRPDHPLAHLVVGMVRMKRDEYAAARDALLRSVESSPGSVKAHYQLSLAYARLGDRESSRHHLERYRQALEQMEQALVELNTRTGTGGDGGM